MSIAKIGHVELYYEEHGRGDPLLLIMGLGADSVAWMFQVPMIRLASFVRRGTPLGGGDAS